MVSESPSLDTIFCTAIEIELAADRDAFVARTCGDNLELRAHVEKLLAAHFRAGRFLESPAYVVGPASDPPIAEGPGTIIGPYKLLEQIGDGGMGAIFMAEQTQPVQRKVALKLIKAGMDTHRVLARFEAERQALALMDHPNIAKVLDAGSTDAGRPYFVMELVKGQPITTYCDEHRLTPRQRLELFLPVCQAIQHAHQKGIIHRDIKASNVLVAPYDGVPVIKVIDFGIAKATGQRLTERTLVTEFGMVMGTLEYMSPEQAVLNNLDIDTRSDVYSLGVLLYELLTGTTPLSRDRLKQAGFVEMLRLIREEEPPRPSTRVSIAKETLPTIAAQRSVEPLTLSGLVRGELDSIVMKALDKDRNRRYESANDFADDVQRYLSDESVLACPPSATYRTRKFVRRHKAGLAIAALALFFIVFLSSAAGLWYQSEQNRSARELGKLQTRQELLTKDMTKLLDDVEWHRKEIHAKLTDPIKVCELLSKIDSWHETLAKARANWQSANNLAANNDDVVTAELILRLQLVDAKLADDVADWRTAKKLEDIRFATFTPVKGKWDQVQAKHEQFFRELGIDWTAEAPAQIAARIQKSRLRHILIGAVDWLGHMSTDRQDKHFETTRIADSDPWRNQVRNVKNWNGPALEKLAREADFAAQSPQFLAFFASLFDSKNVDAYASLRSALIAHPRDFYLCLYLGNSTENLDQKIGCYQIAVALRPNSSPAHNNLGVALIDKKDLDGAVQHLRKAVKLDPNYSQAHSNLGSALLAKKDFKEALFHLLKSVELYDECPWANCSLAQALRETGQFEKALQYLKRGHDLGAKHPGWIAPSGKWIQQAERLVKLERELPSVIKGELDPASPAEWLAYIHICEAKKAHASAAQTWHLLFTKHPNLAADLQAGNRYRAARHAALASADSIADAEKTAMRRFALEWLRADLRSWSTVLQKRHPVASTALAKAMPAWIQTADLAVVRDSQNLLKLPEVDRTDWQALWTQVEQLRKQVDGSFKSIDQFSGVVSQKNRERVHEVKLEAGRTYVVELESKAFDTFLRLDDETGKTLAENDDIAPGIDTNSRLIVTPEMDGRYRLAVSAFGGNGAGPYTLTVREFLK